MISLLFISLISNAACVPIYAKQWPEGDWDTAFKPTPGFYEVTQGPRCKVDFDRMGDVPVNGKWVMERQTLRVRFQQLEDKQKEVIK